MKKINKKKRERLTHALGPFLTRPAQWGNSHRTAHHPSLPFSFSRVNGKWAPPCQLFLLPGNRPRDSLAVIPSALIGSSFARIARTRSQPAINAWPPPLPNRATGRPLPAEQKTPKSTESHGLHRAAKPASRDPLQARPAAHKGSSRDPFFPLLPSRACAEPNPPPSRRQ